MGKKIYLNEKQAACIIHGLAIVISTADCPVEGHDSCDCTVDFLCGFFLIHFHVSGRVRSGADVIHHLAQDRMPAMSDTFLQHQLHQLLGRRRHIFEALTERHDSKAHAL